MERQVRMRYDKKLIRLDFGHQQYPKIQRLE